ncbi:hypothetical protein GCK72_024628 [Caenorhabditis remanei]|uniref:Uncharacterized protein n=1 Tax=Caenorhabditis remanei TaxID=31234 RepID=A0A6A5G083_CAERE|nr:hypothetical protein GCK72_024628 [Caenorhabditis remanei]KAF1748161.1 hypothetical protein GCK72_024628 [Caenorhabditis remanei]
MDNDRTRLLTAIEIDCRSNSTVSDPSDLHDSELEHAMSQEMTELPEVFDSEQEAAESATATKENTLDPNNNNDEVNTEVAKTIQDANGNITGPMVVGETSSLSVLASLTVGNSSRGFQPGLLGARPLRPRKTSTCAGHLAARQIGSCKYPHRIVVGVHEASVQSNSKTIDDEAPIDVHEWRRQLGSIGTITVQRVTPGYVEPLEIREARRAAQLEAQEEDQQEEPENLTEESEETDENEQRRAARQGFRCDDLPNYQWQFGSVPPRNCRNSSNVQYISETRFNGDGEYIRDDMSEDEDDNEYWFPDYPLVNFVAAKDEESFDMFPNLKSAAVQQCILNAKVIPMRILSQLFIFFIVAAKLIQFCQSNGTCPMDDEASIIFRLHFADFIDYVLSNQKYLRETEKERKREGVETENQDENGEPPEETDNNVGFRY